MIKELEFGGKKRIPDIRWLFDIGDVIFDKEWLAKARNFELYYMYRDLFLSLKDGECLREQGLRYDITIIPPGMIGREFIKTAGHYHPLAPNSSVTYPELYEVLEGQALYLLQKEDLTDVVAIDAEEGDKVIVPPNYGHITINPSNKTLKMSNFVARDFSSLYEPFKLKNGGAYFYTKDGWIKNEKYPEVSTLRVGTALTSEKLKVLGLMKGKEMYPLFKDKGCFEYLINPENYKDLFKGLL